MNWKPQLTLPYANNAYPHEEHGTITRTMKRCEQFADDEPALWFSPLSGPRDNLLLSYDLVATDRRISPVDRGERRTSDTIFFLVSRVPSDFYDDDDTEESGVALFHIPASRSQQY